MLYSILRMFTSARTAAAGAAVSTIAIERFQLTLIPAQMLASPDCWTRAAARLLGTQFSFLDLLAYAAGIICVFALDSSLNAADGPRHK